MVVYTLSISNRIIEVCKYHNNIQSDLVKKGLGSKQTISHIFNHRQVPNYEFLCGFLKIFNTVDARWLITGEGKMISDTSGMIVNVDPAENGRILLDKLLEEKEKVGALTKEIEFLKREIDHLRAGGASRGQCLPDARAG